MTHMPDLDDLLISTIDQLADHPSSHIQHCQTWKAELPLEMFGVAINKGALRPCTKEECEEFYLTHDTKKDSAYVTTPEQPPSPAITIAENNEDATIEDIQYEVDTAIKKGSTNHAAQLIADYILDQHHIVTIRDDNNPEMWMYDDDTGIYVPNAKTYINEMTGMFCAGHLTRSIINGVLLRIETKTYKTKEEFFQDHNLNLICLKNGVFNLDTHTLEPHSPDHTFFNQLNITYNKDATCPLITKFLREILCENDATLIEELFGFILYRKYFIGKMFILTGVGANGKTQVVKIIKKFVGDQNWSGITPQQITDSEFLRSDLFGKLVCLSADVSNTDMKNTGVLKCLTGEDPLTANRKFKSSINFINYAKLVFAMNQIPRIDDDTEGMMRRFIIIDFREKFYTTDEIRLLPQDQREGVRVADRFLFDKITTDSEMSGLFNLAVTKLVLLRQNGCFTYSQTTDDVRRAMMLKSNSIMAFMEDFIVEDTYSFIKKDDFKKAYGLFCKTHNVSMSNDRRVYYALQHKFGGCSSWRVREGKERFHAWRGIKWVWDEVERTDVSMVESRVDWLVFPTLISSGTNVPPVLPLSQVSTAITCGFNQKIDTQNTTFVPSVPSVPTIYRVSRNDICSITPPTADGFKDVGTSECPTQSLGQPCEKPQNLDETFLSFIKGFGDKGCLVDDFINYFPLEVEVGQWLKRALSRGDVYEFAPGLIRVLE
jgi:putative DNA primase/helicase